MTGARSHWHRTQTQLLPALTAAGTIAPSVGITEPTVAPLPRWASGISAKCGKTNGMDAAFSACSRVCGSRMDAQL